MRKIYNLIVALVIFSIAISGQVNRNEEADKKGESFSPSKEDFSESLIKQLQLPEGFSINVFAKDLTKPRMMRVNTDGTVYVTDIKEGTVTALKDNDGDGVAEMKREVAVDLDKVHGITIHNNKMYLCAPEKLWSADINENGNLANLALLLDNLPEGGRHENRTIAFGPDGMLYISVGSSCDACDEENPEHATILIANPDGSNRKVFAKGLRNTIGYGWHPETKEMWGMDHGSDWRGNEQPPEEFNRLEKGKDYGWPYCFGKAEVDPIIDNPENTTKENYCANTTPMVLGYTAHAAPIEMIFYTGDMFPAEYKNDVFVAMHGSWNRKPAVGYEVVRIRFNNGKPEKFEQFLKGFLFDNGQSQFGRPAGLCVAKDGSLLISDDDGGVIYRVSYSKK